MMIVALGSRALARARSAYGPSKIRQNAERAGTARENKAGYARIHEG